MAPWSDELLTSTTSLLDDLPFLKLALSHAAYTVLKCGLDGLVSTVIIGLSLNLPVPTFSLKNVAVQCWPLSLERATAISVPVIAWKVRLKNTTMYP